MGMVPTKKSRTVIANIGTGSAINTFTVAITDVGLRSTTGSTQTIKADASTNNILNVGDKIKYVNLKIQTGARNVTGDVPIPDDNGWVEWAFVIQKEVNATMATTNIGTQTLGDTATKQFRGNCIMTGSFPVGNVQPNQETIIIKIPKSYVKFQIGTMYALFSIFRSVNSTDSRTDSHRHVVSCQYKSYS